MRASWVLLGVVAGAGAAWAVRGALDTDAPVQLSRPGEATSTQTRDGYPTLAPGVGPRRSASAPTPAPAAIGGATEAHPRRSAEDRESTRRAASARPLADAWLMRLRQVRDAGSRVAAAREVAETLEGSDPERALAGLLAISLAPTDIFSNDDFRAAVRRWLSTRDPVLVVFALEALGAIGGAQSDVATAAQALSQLSPSLRGRALAALLRVEQRTLDPLASELAIQWWDAAGEERRDLVDGLRTVEGMPPALEGRLLAAAQAGDEATRLQLVSGPLAAASPKSAVLTNWLLDLVEAPGDIGARALQALRAGIAVTERAAVIERMLAVAEGSVSSEIRQLALHVLSRQGDQRVIAAIRRIAENPLADAGTRAAAEVALVRIERRGATAPR